MKIVVTGTDTGIGKTVFASGLITFLDGSYWKPIQAGLETETDSDVVRRLSGLPASRILPELWRLNTPCSPHLAAEIDGVNINAETLNPPEISGPLIIEGAGGLMVPLTRSALFIDVFSRWQLPVVLCARTSLGTINHTLLSVEALQRRKIPILGVAFIGDENVESQRIIAKVTGVRVLGLVPFLNPLDADTLRVAFARAFKIEDFAGNHL